ncbi:Selenium metabolism protein YedF [Desulfamplus magnetovallimortis]|uniref:Selenium metabolism protein YedF n=1 Tax=Desulfamplus magnetovallimortis TaxID=1246637 RepID=A0A1W1HG43_9BACT|nr:sulfurtransferase-like selenium metabolism protein YedF [Desulfamplus magnetovallimortis]SLM31365.1 Selenium metabolism protein YedF [Desulfamplus magnetovallimortis]
MVDNEASMENVSRFFGSRSLGVDVIREGGDFRITVEFSDDSPVNESTNSETQSESRNQKAGAASDATSGAAESHKQKIMVLAATDRMGFGDDELGKKLMISFLKTIKEMGDELWRLVFVNNGVKLAIEGSEVLDDLKSYEADGLKILVCGTCLTHFNLMDAKKVGETTNMLDIVTAMQLADKVIQL